MTILGDLLAPVKPYLPLVFTVVFPTVVAILLVWLGVEVLRGRETGIPKAGKSRNLLYVKIIGKGINFNDAIRIGNPSETYIYKEKEYEIEADKLFKANRGPLGWVADKFRGVRQRYWIFFREGRKKAIDVAVTAAPQTSAETLFLIRRSSALKQALSSLFTSPLGDKKIIFILIVVGAVFLLLVQMGYVTLPAM